MSLSKVGQWVSLLISSSALAMTWGQITYFAKHDDPASITLMPPWGTHPFLSGTIQMLIGVFAGIYASYRLSKWCLVVAALNVFVWVGEVVTM